MFDALTPSTPPTNKTTPLGQVSGMDIRLLHVFATVVDCGGMKAAGMKLFMSASSLSRHIKDLETRLGLVLCQRGRAGFALTSEGQRVYLEASRLLNAVNTFHLSLNDIHKHLAGTFILAIFDKTATNPKSCVAQALAALHSIAPDVHVQMHVSNIADIERGVIEGRYHLGVVPMHRHNPDLQYALLFDETMLLYCGQGHPWYERKNTHTDWSQLREQRFAGLGFHSPNMELTGNQQLLRLATGHDQEAIATFILSGCFLGFLPEHYAQGFVEHKRMRAVNPHVFRYECQFAAIWRCSPAPNRVTLRFVECLEKNRSVLKRNEI